MTQDSTHPEHDSDREPDPDPIDESPEHPDGPKQPGGGDDAVEKPDPDGAGEGKDPADISAAQVV